jgi:hypothetical protein
MTFAVAYGDRETLWLGALVVAFGCWVLLGVWTGWRMARRSTDALLVGAAAFAGLAMVMPENIGDASFVVMRLVMLAWLCVLLWLATLPWSARTLTAVAAGGAILCVGHVALLYPSYVRYARHMESVERLADRIPPRASFASRRVGKTVSRVLPTLHVADLVALKPAVNLSLYQASRSHFLIAYREGVSEDQAAYLLAERTLPRPESGADPLAGLVPAERYRLLATSDDRYTDLYIASDRAPAR